MTLMRLPACVAQCFPHKSRVRRGPAVSEPIQPGWYPDPQGSAQQRWWNGISWGDLQAPPQQLQPDVQQSNGAGMNRFQRPAPVEISRAPVATRLLSLAILLGIVVVA